MKAQVAKVILANKGDIDITHRKLQKLLYYCQANSIVKNGKSIFDDKIEAWDYGPVCRDVWYKYKEYGYSPLPTVRINESNYDFNDINIILNVLATFGKLTEEQIIDISHIDYPWAKQYKHNLNQEITKESIYEYFSYFMEFDKYKAYISGRYEYQTLINLRKSYLSSLQKIGDNWISSNSIAPYESSIKKAEEFLSFSKDLLNMNYKKSIPELIIGPIASGGISIEFENKKEDKLFINIFLDEIEISYRKNDMYTDYDMNYNNSIEQFEKLFLDLV